MKAVKYLTASGLFLGLALSAQAQVQVAGSLLVNIDPSGLSPGPVASVANSGALGGVFEATGLGAVDQPVVINVGGGAPALMFDGHNFMQHVTAAGGAVKLPPAELAGNAVCSIEAWVVNPTLIDFDHETILSWGGRNTGQGLMAVGYSTSVGQGAVDNWSGQNVPWTPVPAAGVWHHLVYTFDGATKRVYADGALNNTVGGVLNILATYPITLAAQWDNGNGQLVGWGGVRGSLSIGKVRIHSGVLNAAQISNNYNFEKATFAFNPANLTAKPIHRYAFNNATTNDAVALNVPDAGTAAGAPAVIQGVYGSGQATFTGKKVHLTGGSSDNAAYVDLPNQMISQLSASSGGSGKVTVEGWLVVNASTAWPRFFLFGSTTAGEVTGPGGTFTGVNYFALHTINNFRDWHRCEIANDGFNGGPNTVSTRDFGLEDGNGVFGMTHYAVSWDEASGEVIVYENGIESTRFTTDKKFNHIDDVNNWLGRSPWSADANLQGDYDEFRIYNRILSPGEVVNDFQGGPDAVLVAPGPLLALHLQVPRTTMMAGTFQQVTAIGDYLNVTNVIVTTKPGITYTSGNTNILTVTSGGRVQAISAGTTTLSASLETNLTVVNITVTPVSATLAHRYSFNGDLADSVGGSGWDAMPNGGASVSGNQMVLDGVSGYVQLPAGIITNMDAVTVEIWASFGPLGDWCRIFEFGDQIGNNGNTRVLLSPHAPGGWTHMEINNGNTGQYANHPGAFDNKNNVHVAAVFNPYAGYIEIYENGVRTAVNNNISVTLSEIKDVVNYIGKSLFSADPYLNGSIDEFRVYNGVMTRESIAVNGAAGPDTLVTTPGVLQAVHLSITNQMLLNLTEQASFTGDFANIAGVNLFAYDAPAISSGNTNVLTVTSAGLVKAVGPGTATLTASYGGKTDSRSVTVTAPQPVLTHRYSFTTDAADSVGGSAWDGIPFGSTISGGQLVLDGGNGNYLQLPGGMVSNYYALTFEAWASFGANNAWVRLWDFGDQNASANANTSIFFSPHNGGGNKQLTIFNTAQGNDLVVNGLLDGQTNVHIVGVYNPYAGYMAIYINGREVGRNNGANVLVSSVNNANSWIGRSLFTADAYLKASVDEFRVYNGALSPAQIAVNDVTGPNSIVPDPGALQQVRFLVQSNMVVDQVQQAQLLGDFANVQGVNLFFYDSPALSSSAPGVVSVTGEGLLTAISEGQATITATFNGTAYSATVTSKATPLALKHRYNFNEAASATTAADSIGQADATLNGATFNGTGQMVLDGTGGFAQLPSGLISVLSNCTFEAWVTPTGTNNWERIFDFGIDDGFGAGSNYVFLAARGAPGMRFAVRPSGGGEAPVLNGPTLFGGTPAHVVATYNVSASMATLYLNGSAVGSGAIVTPLNGIVDFNNFLGRSQYSADSYFAGSYDEFRIYEGALTPAQVAASYAAGPNRLPAPELQAATVAGGNVVIAWPNWVTGATLKSSPTLGTGAVWTIVNVTPVDSGGYMKVTIPATGSAQFFRLYQ